MTIKKQPMGIFQTNCYIVTIDSKDVIIDPGVDASEWVLKNVHNPIAILNTHGHFDHVWSNQELKERLDVPLYTPKEDAFMLQNDPLGRGTPPSYPDVLVKDDEIFDLEGFVFRFLHFPGHTPGCSAILIENTLFSGDFIFKNSIGRVDFPYSNPQDMKKSIKKFLNYDANWEICPGHGENTFMQDEKRNLPAWLEYI
jgi:glyoxylase-like metal-dependent hydrolase (beta-lactamase superfamily II)